MKNKLKTAGALLCLTLLATSAFSLSAASENKDNGKDALFSYAQAEKAAPVKKNMKVCVGSLNIYGNPDLKGAPVATRTKGSVLSVSTEDGLVYCVYTSSGILGYCSSTGLVLPATKTVAKVPFVWEAEQIEIPKEDPEEDLENPDNGTETVTEEGTLPAPDGTENPDGNENPDEDPPAEDIPEAPEYITVIRYSDLTDVNELAYRCQSIGITSGTVLLQRDLLTALEGLESTLKAMSCTLSIESGYSLTPYNDASLADCPASSRSGALVKLTLKDASGGVIMPSSFPASFVTSLEGAGVIRHGQSDWFYFADYENYLEISVSSSDLIYTLYQ